MSNQDAATEAPVLGPDFFTTKSKRMSDDEIIAYSFPAVAIVDQPAPHRLLVQLPQAKKQSEGGIIFAEQSQDFMKYGLVCGKVVAVGDIAFHDRKNGQKWAGTWPKVGDFVQMPLAAQRIVRRHAGVEVEFMVPYDEDYMTVITNIAHVLRHAKADV